MIIEARQVEDKPPALILIPNPEEIKIIESVLGKTVVDEDGLITLVGGRFKLSDGYGPAYISLTPIPNKEIII